MGPEQPKGWELVDEMVAARSKAALLRALRKFILVKSNSQRFDAFLWKLGWDTRKTDAKDVPWKVLAWFVGSLQDKAGA